MNDFFIEMCLKHAVNELINCFAVLPTFHIGFSKTKSAVAQHPAINIGIMDLDIPGVRTVDFNFRQCQQILNRCFSVRYYPLLLKDIPTNLDQVAWDSFFESV